MRPFRRLVISSPRLIMVLAPFGLAGAGWMTAGVVGVCVGGVYGFGLARLHLRQARRHRDRTVAVALRAAVSGMADDLAAGSTATAALSRACETAANDIEQSSPGLGSAGAIGVLTGSAASRCQIRAVAEQLRWVAVQASIGGAVPEALLTVRDPALRPAIRRLAQAWEVAERSGAPLRRTAERLAADESSRARADARREAHASGARTTAVLLACLPAIGIGSAAAIGVDAVAVLTRTLPGAACAVAAALLQVAGTEWTERLVTGSSRR